jgi:protease-4
VERIYNEFLEHVAQGRNIAKANVDSMGQGRVWSGTDAKRLGLIDVLGGMDDAMKIAARMAKIDEYKIMLLPEHKDFFSRILESLSADTKIDVLKTELGDMYPYYKKVKEILNIRGTQARMPVEIDIE